MTTTLTPQQSEPSPPVEEALRRHRVPVREGVFKGVLIFSLAVGIIFLAVLVSYVVYRGWPRLDSRLFNNFPSIRRPQNAGARSAIFGTVWVIAFTALYCLPTGILAAIYLEEYADNRRWYNRLIEINIQNLAAVPSIVYGILGLGIIARGLGFGQTVLTASLTLSLLVLPIVVISAREAIRSVPNSIRLASYAVGATKWQTVSRQVMPQAIPGTATGAILALSRAIGEAAPLLLLGGLTFITYTPTGIQSSFTVLPIQIFNWISRPQEEFRVLAAAAIVVLLVILLGMNAVAIVVRNRTRREW